MGLNSRYEIRVKGVLDERWTAWFEDLQVSSDGEETVISGSVADAVGRAELAKDVADMFLHSLTGLAVGS
jgi:hypothetical protein